MELEAKQLLMAKLDESLLHHAQELCAGERPTIANVYHLQELAEVHCYLKTAHEFNAAEVDALLHFADPLGVAANCWEENSHEYSFPICDLLQETNAWERFPPAEQDPPQKPTVRQQLRTALDKVRRAPPEEQAKGGEAR